MVDGNVSRNGKKPGPDGRLTPERGDVKKRLQKNLLRDIVGNVVVFGQQEGVIPYILPVLPHQIVQRWGLYAGYVFQIVVRQLAHLDKLDNTERKRFPFLIEYNK